MPASERELQHALELLRDIHSDWEGPVAQIECDPVCRFGSWSALPPCNGPIAYVTSFKARSEEHPQGILWSLVTCEHHAQVLLEAVEHWRKMA